MQREVSVPVKVIPSAAESQIVGWDGAQRLRVRLAAVPEKGKANAALLLLFKKELGGDRSSFRIVRGQTSSLKVVMMPTEAFDRLIDRWPIAVQN